MKFKFEWTVALRFLREGRTQTALIIGGATIGVGLIVLITGLINSLQRDLIRRTLGTQPHVIVSPPDEVNRAQLSAAGEDAVALANIQADAVALANVQADAVALANVQARAQRLRSIDQWQPLMAQIERQPGIVAVSPTVSGAALALRGEANRAVSLTGVEAQPYVRVTKLDEKIVAGAFQLGSGEVVIGTQLAQDLGVGVGDKIRLQTARNSGDAFTVRGLFDLGNREANRRNVYVNFRTGQTLLDLAGGASSIDIAIEDVFGAKQIAASLRARTDQKVESWIETSSQLFVAISNQTFFTRLIRIFVAIIVAVGITSVLVVSVVQKQKEIGILRAMGAARGAIQRVFLLQGAIIGVAGAALGSVFGTLLMALLSRVLKSPDGSPFLQLQLAPELYGAAVAVALVFGVLAAIVPARRAAGLDPAQAIRV
jgi:lipoprotein-releasing system permease protein